MYIYIYYIKIILVSRLCDRGDAHSELHSVPSQWTCIPAVTKASKTSRSSLADPSFFTSNSEIITGHSRYESISSIFFKYILNITFTISFITIIQPWINKPLGCLIGRVPFKYHIITIGGIPPTIIFRPSVANAQHLGRLVHGHMDWLRLNHLWDVPGNHHCLLFRLLAAKRAGAGVPPCDITFVN